MPWDMAWASDPVQYQRNESTCHGPAIRLQTDGEDEEDGASATKSGFSFADAQTGGYSRPSV